MVKLRTDEKLNDIEEQIKKLQQKKKNLERQKNTNVGKYLFETWEIEDEQTAITLINIFKESAKDKLRNISQNGEGSNEY
ncbi:hypothetical protein BKK39_17110 [Bacillus cereus]|uniref:hypothetical protein n=1 Tax=Bacillus cereus group TaxID=86661 RepID=UPI000977307F|nr:hypothetical protein [Bacillus cytotoxicus]ONG95153.1 hypothetical protein BKK39_17110 [Bacillus cereus]HDR7741100.1 hypothetical protein [Bacillus pacificus]MDH2866101.1 hypothetical protein [Bacillus cytotoxicus]NZD34418.1 hypothetical protein [Bacillus cytotoxicus]SME01679.1 hypothetical protein BACERE00183_01079 [Bacillus cereus]